jgi:hypothetical protein
MWAAEVELAADRTLSKCAAKAGLPELAAAPMRVSQKGTIRKSRIVGR